MVWGTFFPKCICPSQGQDTKLRAISVEKIIKSLISKMEQATRTQASSEFTRTFMNSHFKINTFLKITNTIFFYN